MVTSRTPGTSLLIRALVSVTFTLSLAADQDSILPQNQPQNGNLSPTRSFDWRPAFKQSLWFLSIQQGYRVALQPDTRAALKGPYLRDWLTSVSNLRGWDDGDTVMANYVGHPMEGAIAGYIQVQNDPRYRKVRFGDEGYWRSRLRAFTWASIYSTNYELGPLGDGAIGNLGMTPGTKGAVDLVITPTLGIGWMVTEDALDRHLIARIERNWRHPVARMMVRSWLNPSRSMANVLRGRWPWYRDDRGGLRE